MRSLITLISAILIMSSVNSPTFEVIKLDITGPITNSQASYVNFRLAHDSNPHEASHGINAMAREKFWQRDGTGVHIGFDANGNALLAWIYEPKTTIQQIKNYIPDFAQGSRYNSYIANQKYWDNVTYLFDEWGAYTVGAEKSVRDALAGNWSGSVEDVVDGTADFLIFATAAAAFLNDYEKDYFNEHPEFKTVFRLMLNRSMDIIKQGLAYQEPATKRYIFAEFNAKKILEGLKSDKQAKYLRKLLVDFYGEDWAEEFLNRVPL